MGSESIRLNLQTIRLARSHILEMLLRLYKPTRTVPLGCCGQVVGWSQVMRGC